MTAAVSPGPSCEICKDSVTVSFSAVSWKKPWSVSSIDCHLPLRTRLASCELCAAQLAEQPAKQANLRTHENTWEHLKLDHVGSWSTVTQYHPIILTWLKLLTSGIDWLTRSRGNWLTRSRGNCLQSESCEPQRPGGFWPEFRRPKVEGRPEGTRRNSRTVVNLANINHSN